MSSIFALLARLVRASRFELRVGWRYLYGGSRDRMMGWCAAAALAVTAAAGVALLLSSGANPLADQEITRVLGQKRDPPRCSDPARDRVDQAGSGPQQSRLAGPVPAHQGHPLPGLYFQVDPAQHVDRAVTGVELDPESLRFQCHRRTGP